MPVAEILAGIALVKSSVDFIKSNIDTCKDIGELGGAIDNLLRGKDEAEKIKNKRGLGVREQFDTAHIAREAIDAKLAAEQLQEISTLINDKLTIGKHSVQWDASNYPSGLYFLNIEFENYFKTTKILLLK